MKTKKMSLIARMPSYYPMTTMTIKDIFRKYATIMAVRYLIPFLPYLVRGLCDA